MNISQRLVTDVMTGVQVNRPRDFAGLGVIFYLPPPRLPTASLGSGKRPQLPVSGVSAIVEVLTALSDRSSGWHDGFHLIDATAAKLTHIAQFIAPPLDRAAAIAPQARPSGARQMTALLTSTLPSVFAVGLISAADMVLIYSGGNTVCWSPRNAHPQPDPKRV